VADQKPPRLEASERETLQALLQYQRDSLVKKVSGVSEEGARTSPVTSGTSLLWLIRHMARAESLWLLHRFAGHAPVVDDDEVRPEDTVESAIAAYRETWPRTDAVVVSALNLDVPCRDTDGEAPVSLRWVLMHLLEETARHAGHADILRELIDGQTGR
jgi:hypothetical protein